MHGVWPQRRQRRKILFRNEHPPEPAVILEGDKSSVVGGDFDVIMRSSDIILDVVRRTDVRTCPGVSPDVEGQDVRVSTFQVGLLLRRGSPKLMETRFPHHDVDRSWRHS